MLAHEVAHVTQRHIARGIEAQSRTSLVSTAAVLAAILLGAAGGASSNATMGAVSAAQGLAAQAQITFTRENEYEADRIGIGVLANAGFDPNAMPAFFDTMFRRTQLGPDRVPELLRTHPVTSSRIAESKDRALQYPPVDAHDTLAYALVKERVRVLSAPRGTDARDYYAALGRNETGPFARRRSTVARLSQIYGGDPEAAIPTLEKLRDDVPGRDDVSHGARSGATGRRRYSRRARNTRARPQPCAAQHARDGALWRSADAGRAGRARRTKCCSTCSTTSRPRRNRSR